jgi:dihydrodipicolinate synthase/N-acetylneuraminate lyase
MDIYYTQERRASQMKNSLSGPYAILSTPFKADGNVNIDALLETVDRLCGTGIRGIIPCGSTGEFVNIDYETNALILREIARITAGRKQLLGGATSPDSSIALKYLTLMAGLGYDAAMVAPPYYFKYTDAEIVAFYRELGGAEFPVMVYNIPAFTNAISLDSYRQLLDMNHIVALKNSSANIKEIMHQIQIKTVLRPEFAILTGTDDAIMPSLAGGCSGSSTALCGMIPKTICGIYEALGKNNFPAALEIQHKLLPILRIADSFPFPFGYKLVSVAMGRSMGPSKHSIPKAMIGDIYPAVTELHKLLTCLGDADVPAELPSAQDVLEDLCL